MKRFVYIILFLSYTARLSAQNNGTFNYQSVLRDLSGNVLANKNAEVKLQILHGSLADSVVYSETRDIRTNALGLINLEIGAVDSVAFNKIIWANGPYFIEVSVDGETLGKSQLLSVPYAMQAQNVVNDKVNDADADSTNELQVIKLEGNKLSISKGNTIVLPDASSGGIQSLSLNGQELSISGGNSVTLPDKTEDADADPTNEIQDITLVGDQLSISGGSTVILPSAVPAPPQTLSMSGQLLTISGGNSIVIPDRYEDADSNPTNEIELPVQSAGDANKALVASGTGTVSWQAISGGGVASYTTLTDKPVNIDEDKTDDLLKTDLINDLTTGGTGKALTAEQGKILKGLVDVNTAKVGITPAQAAIIAATSGTNTGDQDISGITTNATAISTLQSEQTAQNTAIAAKLTGNTAITGATKTKITYDAKGLVTSGTDATTADIAASTDKNYVTDAQLTLLGNTSGTNTGDQDISGIATNAAAISTLQTEQTTQNTAIAAKLTGNTAITGATKTKITYDAKGLVTGGTDATTADIAASTDKNYVTDAQLTLIGNTSGTNTGDQDISGIATNATAISTLQTEQTTQNTAIALNTLKITNATHTGDVTGAMALTIGDDKILEKHLKAVNTPTDEYVLTYEATTGDFEWQAASGGATKIDELSDGKTISTSVFLGANAGTSVVATNKYSTGIGEKALASNGAGFLNTAVGYNALNLNTSGSSNTALGVYSLDANVGGNSNTALGYVALTDNSSGTYNTAVGSAAGLSLTTGSWNTIVGENTLRSNSTGQRNTAIGQAAGYNNLGDLNVFLGYNAGYNEAGSNKLYIANSNTSSPLIYGEFDNNLLRVNGNLEATGTIKIGGGTPGAGKVLTSDANGLASWAAPSSGPANTDALSEGTTNLYYTDARVAANASVAANTAKVTNATHTGDVTGATALTIGDDKILEKHLKAVNTPTDEYVLTYEATTGDFEWQASASGATSIDELSDAKTSNNGANIYLGLNVGTHDDPTAAANIGIGKNALAAVISGTENIGLGMNSLAFVNTGKSNIGVGTSTLLMNTTGINNVAVGSGAGTTNVNGSGNLFLGYSAGYNETGSNKLYVENSSSANPLIYGEFDNDLVRVNGNLETTGTIKIGGGTPGAGKVLTSDANGLASWAAPSSGPANTDALSEGTTNLYYTDARVAANSSVAANTAKVTNATHTGDVTGATALTIGDDKILEKHLKAVNTPTDEYVLTYEATTGDFEWQASAGGATSIDELSDAKVNNASYSLGSFAGSALTTGSSNVFFGYSTAINTSTGSYNVAIGGSALNYNASGNRNTVIGYNAGSSFANFSDNIIIGYQAGSNETGNNKLFIGNGPQALIYGDMAAYSLSFNTANTTIYGTLKLPGNSPGAGKVLTSDASGNASWQTPAAGSSSLVTKTADYTITSADKYVVCTTGGITITLPTAVGASGTEYTIKNMAATNVTIATTSSQEIWQDSANKTTTATLGTTAQNNWIKVVSDGTNWISFRALY